MIDLVFDEITAVALGDEIYLKMGVTVLTHGLPAGAYYIRINVEIKFVTVA